MSTLVDTRDNKYNIKVAYICARIEIGAPAKSRCSDNSTFYQRSIDKRKF